MGGGILKSELNAAAASDNPDEAGKVLMEVATVTVGNTDGYTVAVSGNANLTGEQNSSHVIPSVSSSKTLGGMRNEWGYYGVLDDNEATWNPSTAFKAMTTGQQTVGTGGATTSNVTKKVTLFYGARVDDSIAEDFYGNTVTLSVVAQPKVVSEVFSGISTMQEMTRNVCQSAQINDTAYLLDTRDGKRYWVTKMADKNCWMSQNLELNITEDNIKVADSDTKSDWTSRSSYPPRATFDNADGGISPGSTVITDTYSWNLGKYVLNTPAETALCANNSVGLGACAARGFVNVEGWTPSADPNFYNRDSYVGVDGKTACSKTKGSALNPNASSACKVYDAHYLVGNYYQWNAATAGTATQAGSAWAMAPSSVCPKGWRLPENYNSSTGSTYPFLSAYGLTSSITGTSAGNSYNIALSPLFLVRAGAINPSNNTTYNVGSEGYYWSSTGASDKTDTGVLYLGASSVNWSKYMERWYGRSIRCMAYGTSRPIVGG